MSLHLYYFLSFINTHLYLNNYFSNCPQSSRWAQLNLCKFHYYLPSILSIVFILFKIEIFWLKLNNHIIYITQLQRAIPRFTIVPSTWRIGVSGACGMHEADRVGTWHVAPAVITAVIPLPPPFIFLRKCKNFDDLWPNLSWFLRFWYQIFHIFIMLRLSILGNSYYLLPVPKYIVLNSHPVGVLLNSTVRLASIFIS